MTPRQRQALDFIERYLDAKRVAPSYQEIADELGLASKSGAHRIVEALFASGDLERTGTRVRGYKPAKVDVLRDIPTSHLRAELARREALHG